MDLEDLRYLVLCFEVIGQVEVIHRVAGSRFSNIDTERQIACASIVPIRKGIATIRLLPNRSPASINKQSIGIQYGTKFPVKCLVVFFLV